MSATAQQSQLNTLLDQLAEFLSRKGLKSTRQRDLIATIVFESDEHLNVDMLYQMVRERDPKVGYSTVYRTLRLLKESGLVSERHFGDGGARYEVSREGEHHDHLICTLCGTIVEFEHEEIERLQEALAKRKGFVIESHKHEIYGRCASCRRQARGTS
jgi:Fur family ferric uptake transcriptional regulator